MKINGDRVKMKQRELIQMEPEPLASKIIHLSLVLPCGEGSGMYVRPNLYALSFMLPSTPPK